MNEILTILDEIKTLAARAHNINELELAGVLYTVLGVYYAGKIEVLHQITVLITQEMLKNTDNSD